MPDREKAIGHLQIMHTWADYALEKGVELFDAKHLESIVEWTEEALELLKSDGETAYREQLRRIREEEARKNRMDWDIKDFEDARV